MGGKSDLNFIKKIEIKIVSSKLYKMFSHFIIYLVGVSFPFCVLLAFELLADAVDGDADADTDGVTDDVVAAAAAAAAALLRDVIGEMTADLPPVLIVLLR